LKNGFVLIFPHPAGIQGAEGNYSAQTRVAVLVEVRDNVKPPSHSEPYLTVLTSRGIAHELVFIPDRDHVNVIDSLQLVEATLQHG